MTGCTDTYASLDLGVRSSIEEPKWLSLVDNWHTAHEITSVVLHVMQAAAERRGPWTHARAYMLAIKPAGDNRGDEKLRAICVPASIGH